MTDPTLADLVADLAGEQAALAGVLRPLAPGDWLRPTPSWGWDVRDTVAHLAHTDELAIDTMTGGPRALSAVVLTAASGEDVTYAGVLQGRRMPGAEVLAWWERTSATERDAFLGLDPDVRVPWGLGMRPASFVRARLMETWAHGLDVHTALDLESVDTDRLAHVAWIATRAIPYAYSVAGREPPPGRLRVELGLPDGGTWSSGPEDAADRITGPIGQYCRVFVQRLAAADAADLRAEGPLAHDVLGVARAYL